MNNVDSKGNPLDIGDIVYIFSYGGGNRKAGQIDKIIRFSGSNTCVYTSKRNQDDPVDIRRVLKIPPNLIEAGNTDIIKGYIRLAGIDVSDFNPDNYLP